MNKILLNKKEMLLIACSALFISGCGGGGGGDDDDKKDDVSAGEALTENITISGGVLKSGQPPEPSNNPGDPFISTPVIDAPTITPGMNGTLALDIEQMPLSTTSFNVNVQFDKSTDKYIAVTIDDPTLISNLASQGGSGTINLPFAVNSSVCDDIADIQHQIKCYETVSLPDGTIVTKEAAQDMILACSEASRSGIEYYYKNHPGEWYSILIDGVFVPATSCTESSAPDDQAVELQAFIDESVIDGTFMVIEYGRCPSSAITQNICLHDGGDKTYFDSRDREQARETCENVDLFNGTFIAQ